MSKVEILDLVDEGPWTRFLDMHSGGSVKLREGDVGISCIYLEAAQEEAERLFEMLFERDPNNITCECCGSDYGMSEFATLTEATDYERDGRATLIEHLHRSPGVLVLTKTQIANRLAEKLTPDTPASEVC